MTEKERKTKEKKFIRLCASGMNDTEAYMKAYGQKNYNSARSAAPRLKKRLLANDSKSKKEFAEEQENYLDKIGLSKENISERMKNVINADMSDFYDIENGTLIVKDFAELPEGKTEAIQSIRQTANGIEIKLYDKNKLIDLAAKMQSMYAEKTEVKATVSYEDFLKEQDSEIEY